jgi:hypothetical protein
LFCCPHCILFSDLNVIYFLTERTCLVWVAWLFDHALYLCLNNDSFNDVVVRTELVPVD